MELPAGSARIEFHPANAETSNPIWVADKIYAASRSHRTNHCAIFIDTDSKDNLLRRSSFPATSLDPDQSWHWTGVRHRKNLKSILVGGYEEWFRWFMRWQRWNAFQIVVLIAPLRYMADNDRRGYLDGLITRLLAKPSIGKIIVVEDEDSLPILRSWLDSKASSELSREVKGKFGRRQFREAVASLLYGTHLSTTEVAPAASHTLFSKLNSGWESELQDILHRPSLVDRLSPWIFTAGYSAREMVESMETPEARKGLENSEAALPPLFKQARRRGPSELSEEWLETNMRSLLDSQGWLTIAGFYDHVQSETEKILRTSGSFPEIFNERYDHELASDRHVTMPSRAILREMVERLVAEGELLKAIWVREIGRPAAVYHLPGRAPFQNADRCGQCAFYDPLYRHCRIWWLLNRAYGSRHPRWTKVGERPLSPFEIHKMRNSWRIGPRSSACSRFLDKKRDHSVNEIPERCEVCRCGLLATAKSPLIICKNCRTRYYRQKTRVRVLTSYEHEFERAYKELAGVEPASDIKRLIEEAQSSAPRVVEQAIHDEHRRSLSEDSESTPKTVMLFEGDTMFAREGRLYVFKKRSVEAIPLAGSTLVDHGHVVNEEQKGILESAGMTVRSFVMEPEASEGPPRRRYDIAPAVGKIVQTQPEFLLKISLAMAESCVHATERIGQIANVNEDIIEAAVSRQRTWMRRLASAPPSRFLVYEAAMMREYWGCYYLPIRASFQRSGPRKKARFVREFVTDPMGRARGYTAVDAAINYLHQRRLYKARSINIQLGLASNPGEGFLHRKRWNPEGLGLVLDLIDPFKFADREKLLGAIVDFSLNWRDFYGSADRRGVRFYYPKPEAVGVLEAVGNQADQIQVPYEEIQRSLEETYKNMVSSLIKHLKDDAHASFVPFVYEATIP